MIITPLHDLLELGNTMDALRCKCKARIPSDTMRHYRDYLAAFDDKHIFTDADYKNLQKILRGQVPRVPQPSPNGTRINKTRKREVSAVPRTVRHEAVEEKKRRRSGVIITPSVRFVAGFVVVLVAQLSVETEERAQWHNVCHWRTSITACHWHRIQPRRLQNLGFRRRTARFSLRNHFRRCLSNDVPGRWRVLLLVFAHVSIPLPNDAENRTMTHAQFPDGAFLERTRPQLQDWWRTRIALPACC